MVLSRCSCLALDVKSESLIASLKGKRKAFETIFIVRQTIEDFISLEIIHTRKS